MRKFLFLLAVLLVTNVVQAQKQYYSVIQLGGNLGFANEGFKGAFSGYHFHFIFGRNFDDKLYLGLGLGNEKFTGDYQTNDPHEPNQQVFKYDYNVFPLFADVRLPIGGFNETSKIGLLANAGYSAAIGPAYDKGALFKAGFYYLHERMGKSNLTGSLTYGYQQLTKNAFAKDFQHQQINLTIGFMLK
ncbi:hypothetical protein ACFRAE_09560 [Sphingobacterium sp. HJSM2_6]|uniref:hypothetical protein n=1 Tax=Sphingobacterium sp. HJSM2_6 TaxID=3366264 RepID=UPI003BE90150